MNYTIIGTIHGYQVNDILPFIKSIEESGFIGRKIMIVYENDKNIETILKKYGWEIEQRIFYNSTVIYNQRLIDASKIVKNIDTDIVLFLDVFDIVFNKNPIEWIEKNFKGGVLSTSESLKFKDDDWSTFIGSFFPNEWDWIKDNEIQNCGVIVGERLVVSNLLNSMFFMGIGINKNNYPFDQITFNIQVYDSKYNTQFIKQQEGFVCHLTLKDKYKEPYFFTEKLPTIIGSKVYNDIGEEYYVIHQYKKIAILKEHYEKIYHVENIT